MMHIINNTCPICLDENLNWDLNYSKSKLELFSCGHGVCKKCFIQISKNFKCCLCRNEGQQHTANIHDSSNRWLTFNDWYNDFEIYIKAGSARNIINNTSYGKQLKRLYKESKNRK